MKSLLVLFLISCLPVLALSQADGTAAADSPAAPADGPTAEAAGPSTEATGPVSSTLYNTAADQSASNGEAGPSAEVDPSDPTAPNAAPFAMPDADGGDPITVSDLPTDGELPTYDSLSPTPASLSPELVSTSLPPGVVPAPLSPEVVSAPLSPGAAPASLSPGGAPASLSPGAAPSSLSGGAPASAPTS